MIPAYMEMGTEFTIVPQSCKNCLRFQMEGKVSIKDQGKHEI